MTEHQKNQDGGPERDVSYDPNPDDYQKYADFFENASIPMHWVGPDGTVLHANQAELDALGYTRDEYIGYHIAEFHADQDVIDDILDRLGSDEELHDYEARMERKDGSIRHVLIDSSVNWKDGEFVNTRCVTRDITERKEYELEIKRQNERLEDFAGIVSHDLRNPLSVIAGRLELLREDGDSSHLEPIERSVDRMNRIIEDLLWLSREGKDIGPTEPVDLQEAVESAWDFVGDGSHKIQFVACSGGKQTIQADGNRLAQLLENIFRNAIEHGDANVTAGVLADGFYIEDDGPGIPKEEWESVFDAGHSTITGGTGFGLSIVKQVVEAHDWDVRVTEGSDGGARFEVTGVEFTAG